MKNHWILLVLFIASPAAFGQVLKCSPSMEYGNNEAHGKFAQVNGIEMYYETYGDPSKQPILLIHGNGGSVKAGTCQIEFFKEDYFVVVADSRYQGKSGKGDQALSYDLMASDYNELLNHLKLDSVFVIGQSDGGIIGLLLAINYPSKVKKVMAAAPNLRPDSTALYDWNIADMKADMEKINSQIQAGNPSQETLQRKALTELMLNHPNITHEELQKIQAPVLLVFGDSDYMPMEHIQEIYEHIPQANLLIVPAAGHRAYRLEPEIFNSFAQRFFENPFQSPKAKDGF